MKNKQVALTDKDFWRKYWESFSPRRVPEDIFLADLFNRLPAGRKTFIEIGGFPGTYSVYFSKYRGYDVTLLDHFILPDVIKQMEDANSLPLGSITVIEADFLSSTMSERFDVVFSLGFIEHFADTRDVMQRHVDLLKEGGYLFISLPNFRGLNGWVQRTLDPANYMAHNVDSMVLGTLKSIAVSLGIRDVSVSYYGNPVLWLEQTADVFGATRALVRLASKAVSRIPLQNSLLSPFIVIIGQK